MVDTMKMILAPTLLFALLAATAAAQPTTADLAQIFATSDLCIGCHNGLVAPNGLDLSIGVDWRSSMMAHSSRDPYWQASLRRETMAHPSAAAAIEHECTACHMPMARFAAKAAGELGKAFAHLPVVAARSPEALLAADGVSCAMCHQIRDENLGEKASFTAGFVVDTTLAPGSRPVFGPYDVDAGRQHLMTSASQFVPEQAAHIQSSELCATCHTLYTHALDENGEAIAELPEQVPYLEWKHSAYHGTRSCQSCHMPEVEGETAITGVLGQPRKNVSRHVFRGGNFFMPRILNRHRDELGVEALPQELETTSIRTAEHLETSAARLSIEDVRIEGDRLRAEVVVTNLAGHKLPSAYPSRRAWLHVTVRDAGGGIVFESGGLEPDGSIAGNDNDLDPSRFEPHHAEIASEEDVPIYEGILAGPDGAVTTVLLTAVRYVKDNRLLPDGFDKATADEDIAVRGAAAGDDDFAAGSDRVRYVVSLPDGDGPFTIDAELRYQPIAFRWARNLLDQEAPETVRFAAYYDELAEFSSVVLARATASRSR
jgi:hypothetical protein